MRLQNPADIDQAMYQYDAVQDFLIQPLNFGEVNVPVLALCGANDRTVPPENSRLLGAMIPNGEFVSIEKADHIFFLEKQEETAEIVNTFFLDK